MIEARSERMVGTDVSGLSEQQLRRLGFAINVALALMLAHDLDHLRVIVQRGYSFHISQLTTVFIAYIPQLFALFLLKRRSDYAALACFTSGAVLMLGFATIHLLGLAAISPSLIPLVYEWGASYCALKVDTLTWSDLWINFGWAALISALGLKYVLGQLRHQGA